MDQEHHCPDQLIQEKHIPGQSESGSVSMITPWVISILLHIGLGITFAFVTIIVTTDRQSMTVIIPEAFMAETPGLVVNPGTSRKTEKMRQKIRKVQAYGESTRETQIPPDDSGKTDEVVNLMALGGGAAGGTLADFGLTTPDRGKGGPASSFGGLGGNAHHIVYVIDRSGSMLDSFETVKRELVSSVAMLKPRQTFHVILFGEGKPIENTPLRLVAANDSNKLALADFIENVVPEGPTNPLPAINRAFDVLQRANPRKQGKLIYLLTDGDFRSNGVMLGDKAIGLIRKRNVRKRVKINTFLYEFQPISAERVMRRIAAENGGRYRHISQDE